MRIEISRRKFLQGSVALAVVGASASASIPFSAEKSPKKGAGNTRRKVATLCEMCVNKCAAVAVVENDAVVKLEPNPLFPKSKNMLCPRGNAGIDALYDSDRLKYPLIRVGERGDGQFKRVTWDEAYTYITEKVTKILDEEEDNRSTFCFSAGEGMAEHTFKTFFQMFGSANWLNHSSICLQTAMAGYKLTIGDYGQADLENAQYIIMAGANRAESIVTPDTTTLFKRTKGRGAKLVVIDPRFTNTAAKADAWLPINVGTDLALVLAMTHVVLTEELYDKAFVNASFEGFDAYKAHVLSSGYTPEWAAPITGIGAGEIQKIAREFMAHAPRAVYYQGRRSTFSKNDFQMRRATAIFNALGGCIDTKGGICFGKKLPINGHSVSAPLYFQAAPRSVEEKEKPAVGESGYADCAIVGESGSWIAWRNLVVEEKTPYPVRGMFIYKHNPMMSVPDSAKTKKMFEKLDLVVTIDTMPSDTVIMSDVVLPECTYLERTDPVATFGGIEPAIAQRNKVIDPMYESKPVMEIMRGLTQKISKPLFEVSKKHDMEVQDTIESDGEASVYKEFDLTKPFVHSQEELNEHAVADYPGAAEALKEGGVFYPGMEEYFKQLSVNEYSYYPEEKKYYSVRKGRFNTPSGKIECVLPNLADKGIDPMPTWKKEYEPNIPADKFVLITGRHAQFTQSGTSNNAMLLDLMNTNYLWINKRKAKAMGIAFGDLVEVESRAGKIAIKAYPTEKIGDDTVFMIHGFGATSDGLSRAHDNGGNDNAVIEDHIEPVYGAAVMHETHVSIRRV
jgi:thiosulfate reductase/polysulfide reductase chain A